MRSRPEMLRRRYLPEQLRFNGDTPVVGLRHGSLVAVPLPARCKCQRRSRADYTAHSPAGTSPLRKRGAASFRTDVETCHRERNDPMKNVSELKVFVGLL